MSVIQELRNRIKNHGANKKPYWGMVCADGNSFICKECGSFAGIVTGDTVNKELLCGRCIIKKLRIT